MTAPGPYAPGIIAEPRPSARAARRPALFLWATFVGALANPGMLWLPQARMMLLEKGGASGLATFTMLTSIPSMLVLLWAYLGDRVPILSSRREGHLALAALVSAAGWLAAAFAPAPVPVLLVSIVLALGAALQLPAIDGALVEIGQRRGTTRLLAAASVGLARAGELVLVPLGVVLVMLPAGWTAGLGAALALSTFGLVVAFAAGDEPTAAPAADPAVEKPPVHLGRYLGSRAFWASMVVVFCAQIGTIPQSLASLQIAGKAHMAESVAVRNGIRSAAAVIVAAAVYALIGRLLAPRRLLRLSLAALALGNIPVAALRAVESGWLPEVAALAQAFGGGLAAVAAIDLALRAAPRGREASGYVLVAGAPVFVAGMISSVVAAPIIFRAPASLAVVTIVASVVALAGLLAVGLVPPDLTESGRPEPR
jgi:hypothetical protein